MDSRPELGDPMTARALGAAIIVLTAGAAALAADLPVTAVPVTPVWPRTWDWNGFYGGINAGVSFGEAKNFWDVPPLSVTGTDRETQIGPLGGIQLGWNWQYSALLWGLEGDIDVAGQRGKATFNSPFSVTTGSGQTATTTSGTATIPLRDDVILIGTLRG